MGVQAWLSALRLRCGHCTFSLRPLMTKQTLRAASCVSVATVELSVTMALDPTTGTAKTLNMDYVAIYL